MLHIRASTKAQQRTILSGIGAKMADPAILIGKKVIVVANLKTATLMGIESQGMILAAEAQNEIGFDLPSFTDTMPGAGVS